MMDLLHDIAISEIGWEQCLMYDQIGHRRPQENFVVHGLYGSIINNEKGFFTNDPLSHPYNIDVLHDHPPITSFLGVPLVLDRKIVGMLGVANRDGGYSSEQQEDLEAIAPAIIQALQRQKSEGDLREAYENLKLHSKEVQIRSEKLQKTTEIMDAISQNSSELLFAKDCQSRIVYASDSFLRFFGKLADEILGKTDVDFYSDPLISEAVMKNDRIVRETRQSLVTEESVRLPDGSLRIYLSTKSPWLAKDGTLLGTMGFSVGITERKRAEQESEMMVEFLQLVNKSRSTVDLVHSAVNFFRERSGFEAVGIRLKDDEDYPYFETSGFPAEFVKLENSLFLRYASGQLIHDIDGYPIHECMCGNVICGRFDPSKPFFTTLGSFCTNCTTELATTTDADRQAHTHNRCNGEGYESVALIALRVGEERPGPSPVERRCKGRFTPEMILMLERLADYLAVAIAKTKADESLQKAQENLQTQSEDLQAQSEELHAQNEELQAQSKELYEAYENLRVSEIRYRGLFETLQEAFFINRLIYDEQGKVVDWIFEDLNPAGFKLLGLKNIDEAKGKRGSEVLGCERAAFHLPMIEEAKLSNKAVKVPVP